MFKPQNNRTHYLSLSVLKVIFLVLKKSSYSHHLALIWRKALSSGDREERKFPVRVLEDRVEAYSFMKQAEVFGFQYHLTPKTFNGLEDNQNLF